MTAPSDATLEPLVRSALNEDIGTGDITTQSLIPPDKTARARLMAREKGVLCGVSCARLAFQLTDKKVRLTFHKKDGDALSAKDCVAEIEGPMRAILTAERVALNFLTHLSGIASLTQKYVQAVEGTKAKILCTRKTLPNLRLLEKYAVTQGGGHNHRFGLYDAILIKDNHLACVGSIKEAVSRARALVGSRLKVEVEVDTLAQLEEALATSADIIMLDNFSVFDLRKAVEKVGSGILLEASGGISLANVRNVAETGVDFISVGAITHSAPSLDLALDF